MSKSSKGDILIVDDQPATLKVLTSMLTEQGYRVRQAISGPLALKAVRKSPPDLILLDILMPDMDGYEVIERLKADEGTRDIPIIFISVLDDIQDKVKGFAAGGVDYVARPFQEGEVLARVETHLALRAMRKQLEEKNARLEQEITERVRAEEGLRESEEKYRLLVESANEGIVVAQDGMLKFFNPKAMEIVGHSQEELASKPFAELIHPDDREMAVEYYLKSLQGKETPQVHALRIIDKDGSIKWLESGVVLINWEDRPATLNFLSDITERKRAEEALRESEEKLKAQYKSIPVPTYTWQRVGEDFVLVDYNDAAVAITRDRIADFVGIEARELHRDMPEIVEDLWQSFTEKTSLEREMVYRYKSTGESKHLAVKYAFVPPDLVLVHTEDITERKRAEEALCRSLEETARTQRLLLALCQAAEAVQRARTPEEVYRTVGDGVTGLGYHAAVFTLTDDRAYLALSHLTFEPALLRATEKLTGLPAQDYRFPLVPGGFYQRIIAEGETFYSMSFTEAITEALPRPLRPLVGRLASLMGVEQGIFAPLTVGGKTHGLLVVTGTGLTEADVSAVSAFAHQAAIAAENARLYEAERAAREQLRNLASYLQTAREAERTYIAREIHDEFGQVLTALKMDLAWLSKRLPADKTHLAEKASAMSDLIDATIQTVRRVATELRPGLLDDLGLAAAIEWQAQEFAERTGIDCELHLSDEDIVLDRDLTTAIFRIFQETLTNVARHAEATAVRVELEDRSDELVLIVQDDGKGITESQVSDPKSLGLIGMRERARACGGDVAFQSVPGQGTTVTVQVSWPNAEERRK